MANCNYTSRPWHFRLDDESNIAATASRTPCDTLISCNHFETGLCARDLAMHFANRLDRGRPIGGVRPQMVTCVSCST